jgi:glycosyltransferase involved in cell wall biosynthesis
MVIISNGFSKHTLAVTAAEAERRQLLTSFLTGAYPTPLIRKILSLPYLRSNAKANRLAARGDQITDGLVHALFASEALHVVGLLSHSESLDVASMRFYGRQAVRHVKQAASEGARIYHYRAGFGGESVAVAKKCGMFTLCDHSIAHPSAVDALAGNMGRMPAREEMVNLSPFWSHILDDIEQADAVLVNSQFVKDTFEHAGRNHFPVHVIYLGVDDSFLAHLPERGSESDEFRLLFAGTFEQRKGAEILMDAMGRLKNLPWRLEVAGKVSPALQKRSQSFFSDPRVKSLGYLSLRDLASAMARADVFVFPSLAEGSARVVFDALACGCYVITTPNSGSIVEQGVHGAIVHPGDSAALADAIEYAQKHRDEVSRIGKNNAQLIRTSYMQSSYGDKLCSLYKKVLGEEEARDH